eukprot:11877197-Alexandrium_andersonii.AAC.1
MSGTRDLLPYAEGAQPSNNECPMLHRAVSMLTGPAAVKLGQFRAASGSIERIRSLSGAFGQFRVSPKTARKCPK